jgi:hypothetical protein
MENLKEIFAFLAAIHMGVEKSLLSDSKINFADLPNFMPAVMKIIPAITDAQKVIDEVKSMSEADKVSFVEWFKAEYNLENEKVESMVEAGINVALGLAQLVLPLIKK